MAVIGGGDVGHALARYEGFTNRGFQVTNIFDSDPGKIGSRMTGIVVQSSADMIQVLRENNIKVAILTTPAESAQGVTEQLVEAGVKAILNYAPIELKVPPDVHVEHIDPAVYLQKLSYYLEE